MLELRCMLRSLQSVILLWRDFHRRRRWHGTTRVGGSGRPIAGRHDGTEWERSLCGLCAALWARRGSCSIYERRPTPCREFEPWLPDGVPGPIANAYGRVSGSLRYLA